MGADGRYSLLLGAETLGKPWSDKASRCGQGAPCARVVTKSTGKYCPGDMPCWFDARESPLSASHEKRGQRAADLPNC